MATLPLTILSMSMKVMSSREAQNAFGHFLDTAQHEPVIVTRRNRPVGVMLSMDSLPALLDLADNVRASIKAGILAGLEDAKAGRMHELNDDYIATLKLKAQQRIDDKNAG